MLIINLFLLVNGLLYIVLGLWCAIRPEQTATSVGLAWESNQGLVEYFTVYGGLEFALGVFFLFCALKPDYANAGVIFGVCLYGGLAVFRTIAIFLHGGAIGYGYMFYAIEAGMLVFSLIAAQKIAPSSKVHIHPKTQSEPATQHSLSNSEQQQNP